MANEACSEAVKLQLEALLKEKFFDACVLHENAKTNRFCMDCTARLCQHCEASHQIHHIVKIKRYMKKDVIALKDAEKILNCSSIQSFITNGGKVVFLKYKPVAKGSSNRCIMCGRNLGLPFSFCSISCKIGRPCVSEESESLKLHCASTRNKDSEEDSSMQEVNSSTSSSFENNNRNCNLRTSAHPPITESTNQKNHRRKNIPHRAPLF